jgi:hypothetical protein
MDMDMEVEEDNGSSDEDGGELEIRMDKEFGDSYDDFDTGSDEKAALDPRLTTTA